MTSLGVAITASTEVGVLVALRAFRPFAGVREEGLDGGPVLLLEEVFALGILIISV